MSESDVFDIYQISEELIKEVMDSSFISSSTKIEFCNKLLKLQKEPVPIEISIVGDSVKSERPSTSSIEEVRSKMLTQMSIMTGFMVMTLTIFITFFKEHDLDGAVGALKEISPPVFVLIAAVTSMIMAVTAKSVLRELRHHKNDKDLKKIDSEENDEKDKTE